MGRLGDLQPLFMEHMLVQFTGYEPDLPALEAHADRLVIAVGVDSRKDLPFQTTARTRLIVNLDAARRIGLSFPEALIDRAAEVIGR